MRRPGDHRGSVVLLVHRYPPMVGPGSHRAASFARHLPESGWDPFVVTVKGSLFHRDPSYLPPPVRTLRTRSPEPTKLLAPLRGRSSTGAEAGLEVVPDLVLGPVLGRVRRLVINYAYVPDAYAMWIPFAIAGVRSALRRSQGPKVLLSSSVPYSAHLAAMAVARREGTPWVAEFRDPWAQLDDRIRARSPARKRVDAALERRVVETADALVVTSDLTREAMKGAYPGLTDERIWVVRNGYEPGEGPASPPAAESPLRLVNAGSVPGETSLEPLLRGIDHVHKEHPGQVELLVFAPSERWRRAASALSDPSWLKLEGLVSPAEARRAIAGASANVLLRPGEHHRQYVAAKLMDYLGARRPIVGIVSASGEMAALGRAYGDMRLVSEYAERSVAAVVEELFDQHRRGLLLAPAEGRRPVADLTRAAQVSQLAGVLESVL